MSPLPVKEFTTDDSGNKYLHNTNVYASRVEIGGIDIGEARISPDLSPSETRKLLSMAVYGNGIPAQVAKHAESFIALMSAIPAETEIAVFHPAYDDTAHTVDRSNPVLTFTLSAGALLAKLSGDKTVKPTAHNWAIPTVKPEGAKKAKAVKQVRLLSDLLASMQPKKAVKAKAA